MNNLDQIENQRRTQIIKYKALLEQGALTSEEYTELCQDQFDLDTISGALHTEELRIQAEKIIQALRVLSGLI